MLTNPVRLVRHQGTWYFWYEEPYTTLSFPGQGGFLLVSTTTSSPHTPFVWGTDTSRKGVPLAVVAQDERKLVLRRSSRSTPGDLLRTNRALHPLRFNDGFGGNGLDNFSGLRLTLSLETGTLEVATTASCATRFPAARNLPSWTAATAPENADPLRAPGPTHPPEATSRPG